MRYSSAPKIRKGFLRYCVFADYKMYVIRLIFSYEGGYCSSEGIPLSAIVALEGKPITSKRLKLLYINKSRNNGSFLLAVLLKEGLVKRIGRNQYELTKRETWRKEFQSI